MHVAQGDGEQAAGDAGVGHLHGAGVGARRARLSLDLVGDAGFFGGLDHVVEDDRVDVRAAADDRAAREAEATELAVIGVGVVGRMADVDGDADVGVDGLGGDLRAAHADFLLRGRDGGHGGGEGLLLGQAPEGLHADVSAGLVVERAGHADAAAQHLRAVGVHGGVADPHDRQGVGPVVHADIDPHVMTLRDALAVLGREQVHGTLAGDAEHRTLAGQDVQAAAGGDDLVVAAEELEVQVALVVDVGDDESDLVDVAGEHQGRAAVALEGRDAVADGVLRVGVRRLLNVAVDHRLRGELVTRRGLRDQEVLEEVGVVGDRRGFLGHAAR